MTFTPAPQDDFTELDEIYTELSKLIFEKFNYTLIESEEDLFPLQEAIDYNIINEDKFYLNIAIGYAFGKLLKKKCPDFDWALLQDEHGSDIVLRYKETDFQVDCLNLIASKVANKESIDIQYIFTYLLNTVEEQFK